MSFSSIITITTRSNDIDPILEKARKDEISYNEIVELLKSDELWKIGKAAFSLKKEMYGDTCTYIKNMILNYTNVCIVRCKFCAFYREPGHGYLLPVDEAFKRVKLYYEKYSIRQVLIQGGVNPEVDIDYFVELFKRIKEELPKVAIHALSPVEIDYLSRKHKMSYKEVLEILKSAGMDSLPGGGAELLVERVRKEISPLKIDTNTWLRIMETAHELGIPTSVTMMYGHIETAEERALHLFKLRELQKRRPGSMAFIAWNFEPDNTQLARERRIRYPWGGWELLRIIAVARLVFKDYIPHIQSGWLTVGHEVAQLALLFGADDWGGTLYDERVIPATGLKVNFPREEEIRKWISAMNCKPVERDNWYRVID